MHFLNDKVVCGRPITSAKEVDARPGDVLALAFQTGSPIYELKR
jgi:bifunctional DNase/RNase